MRQQRNIQNIRILLNRECSSHQGDAVNFFDPKQEISPISLEARKGKKTPGDTPQSNYRHTYFLLIHVPD